MSNMTEEIIARELRGMLDAAHLPEALPAEPLIAHAQRRALRVRLSSVAVGLSVLAAGGFALASALTSATSSVTTTNHGASPSADVQLSGRTFSETADSSWSVTYQPDARDASGACQTVTVNGRTGSAQPFCGSVQTAGLLVNFSVTGADDAAHHSLLSGVTDDTVSRVVVILRDGTNVRIPLLQLAGTHVFALVYSQDDPAIGINAVLKDGQTKPIDASGLS
jgi:hypothetical protein